MSDLEILEISVIKKAIMPPKKGTIDSQYQELLRRCSDLSDDEALKVKCSTRTHAHRIKRVIWQRNKSYHTGLMAFSRTEPEGIFVYIYKGETA
jgi:hypothetical protein